MKVQANQLFGIVEHPFQMPEFTNNWLRNHMLPAYESWLTSLKNQAVHFLEIGTFQGQSARWWLDNILTHKQSSLTCVDPYPHFLWRKNIPELKARLIPATILEALPLLRDSYDFILIDGSHEKHDIILDASVCWRRLKVGGLMLFDDYLPKKHKLEPFKAIDAFIMCHEQFIEDLGIQGHIRGIRRLS